MDTARGRMVGLLVVVGLAVGAGLTASLAVLDTPDGGVSDILALEFAGTADTAQRWTDTYGADAISAALLGDVLFILFWSPLLALLALWAGQNFRTLSTRRLAAPLALAALGAGVLDLLEDASLLLAVGGLFGGEPTPGGWVLGAAFSWGKSLIVLTVVAFVAGGLLSLLLRRDIRATLRSPDETLAIQGSRTLRELVGTDQHASARPADDIHRTQGSRTLGESDFGLAFSGGGIRAASITLGALQALEVDEAMGWDAADHITSVSGGSYMAGAWSLARTATAGDPAAPRPVPWASGGVQPGPEERHLRANLGYLLSNTPRGVSDDPTTHAQDPGRSSRPGTLDRESEAAAHARATTKARAERRPSVIATVLTGMALNALVFLGILWAISQPVGWFYRWYVGLACTDWSGESELDFGANSECLSMPSRMGPPIIFWLILGLGLLMLWVLAAKLTETTGAEVPPAWLLALKYTGYGGLGLGAALTLILGIFPFLLQLLWRPVEANALLTTVLAVVSAIGSGSALTRTLRKPLAKLAPVIGGLLFAVLLLFLICRWALGAMVTGPGDGHWVPWVVVVAVLLAVHFAGTSEFWSLAAFYRGKLRAAFATYRHGPHVHAYGNNSKSSGGERFEPDLASLRAHTAAKDRGTPLTICGSATVSGRDVRTHYGIPALSVTFSPTAVRLFAPLEEDGLWLSYGCSTEDMAKLMPKVGPRLTTMMAVGLSAAAVSPAMGRFRIGPISMLLAFANVRLGMWIPNPRYVTELARTGKRLPRPGLGYLLKEFFGFHDHSDLYLYVTDGGHWENTALVELLRTSHHLEIVCVDADSGPGNLAGSISKAIDLAQLECAASVAIRLDVLRSDKDPSPGRDYSPRSVNLGLIRRTDGNADLANSNEDGAHGNAERLSVFWYCKPALTEDMPPTLLAYREVDPSFPRVNTVNQFFHVAQFAAYRDLGRYNATKILAARKTLAAALAGQPDFAGYRASLPDDEPEGPQDVPEGWVLTELVRLIDYLAADRPPGEQQAYAQDAYATVRTTLGRTATEAATPAR